MCQPALQAANPDLQRHAIAVACVLLIPTFPEFMIREMSALQGSCDGVVDLTQPTQVYQSTLTMADCQPHQSSLQQPVATGVFTEDDDGDEVICVD